MSGAQRPQDLVEQALALSKSDGCIVIAGESTSANLRWATNTLTAKCSRLKSR